MSKPESEAAREAALSTLREGKRFLLVGHERPDGDCIGSQAALARVLLSLGKEVAVVNPDAPSSTFAELVRSGPFGTWKGKVPAHDVCVLLDFNVLSRCGPMEPALAAAPSRKVIIDHHPLGEEAWWDEAYVDVSAAATGLLVYRIARAFGVKPDPIFARAVFTSIVTDTGWFRYSNTDAETFATAGELVGEGVSPAEVYRSLHQQSAASEPAAIGRLLARTVYYADGRLAVVDLPLASKGERPLDDTDTPLDILRAVKDVEVVLFLRAREDGQVKLSARSKSTYDVNALARRFGGGGHVKAAGATIRGSLEDVRARLVEAAVAGFGAS
jgi:bifunctional oligoribonuclease and PAP phosphatase NrnA